MSSRPVEEADRSSPRRRRFVVSLRVLRAYLLADEACRPSFAPGRRNCRTRSRAGAHGHPTRKLRRQPVRRDDPDRRGQQADEHGTSRPGLARLRRLARLRWLRRLRRRWVQRWRLRRRQQPLALDPACARRPWTARRRGGGARSGHGVQPIAAGPPAAGCRQSGRSKWFSRSPPASSAHGSSPLTSVVKAVTGSTSSGGAGPVLPIILVGSLLGAGALALLRRQRTS